MKKALIIILIISSSSALKAQVGFSYHQSSIVSSFGVSSNPDKNLWGEARISTNSNQFDITGMVLFNVLKRDDFKLYTGLGLGTVFFEGNLAVAMGVQVKPIKSKDNLTIFGEFTPLFDLDDYISSGSVGFRYFLKRKK